MSKNFFAVNVLDVDVVQIPLGRILKLSLVYAILPFLWCSYSPPSNGVNRNTHWVFSESSLWTKM